MKHSNPKTFIKELDGLAYPIIDLMSAWINADDNSGDLRIPLLALSKVTALHIQAMTSGLDLDASDKEYVIQLFIGGLSAALDDLDGFEESEKIINKMMGKS